MYALPERGGKLLVDRFDEILRQIARTEVGEDDEFVFELVGALQDVVQMSVAELVNLLLAMLRAVKGHLRDENLCFVNGGVVIQADGSGVAEITDQRNADFAGNFGS